MSAKKMEYLENNKPANTAVVGYDASRYNAVKHGVYSQYTVMHWENREDYNALFNSLMIEHNPQAMTEAHLVEELAGTIWRKMRLKHAEMASLQGSLRKTIEDDSSFLDKRSAQEALLATSLKVENFDIRQAVLATQEETQDDLVAVKKYLKCCLTAEQILLKTNLYEQGLAALHKSDQDEWQNEYLANSSEDDEEHEEYEDYEEGEQYSATVESLMSYVNIAKKHYEKFIYELTNREKVKNQALGKAFFSDNDMNKFTKYENHLDRKFEKTLAMLLKMKELRETKQI